MTHKVFDTPEAAEAAFYAAFTAIDLELMAAVWASGDRALCIHPGSGLLQGKGSVMQSWIEIFSGAAPPLVEYRIIKDFSTSDLAVRVVEEHIRPRDKPAEAASRVLATNVYLRQGSSWHLAEHHASLPLMERTKTPDGDRQLH
jgi:hypothetical protein